MRKKLEPAHVGCYNPSEMKKLALVFFIAVLAPSLVLAWLAVRSIRDQQFVIERQRSLLYQGVADSLAKEAENLLSAQQRDFRAQVETLLAKQNPGDAAQNFDTQLRANWPLAQIGFVVSMSGQLLCPLPSSSPEAQVFCSDNGKFLRCSEVAEVFLNNPKTGKNLIANDANVALNKVPQNYNAAAKSDAGYNSSLKAQQTRNIVLQQQINAPQGQQQAEQLSKLSSSEGEFCKLVADETEGALARFLENKLNVLVWYRSPRNPQLVFGAQLALDKLGDGLRSLLQEFHPETSEEICLAILDDKGKPVAQSLSKFQTNWKHPFAATEIGEALPHWEAVVYLTDPKALTKSAQTLKLTLGLLIAVLLVAISIGSWLILSDVKSQLKLARQKTDFVSNVSHELKTPLTSIRMFAELLAENRVADREKQRSYLQIITSETARLTRLINNVLDFARMERGEKKYNFAKCNFTALVRDTAEAYRPHLESNGFKFDCGSPSSEIPINCDRDALAQIIVNLLSNAEKYSDGKNEISVKLEQKSGPLPHAELRVMDRGIGVPRGSEENIFEKFYRVHDSLNSGIQGSGLGLTLARQIARAHGGDVTCEQREGGGSCFVLRLPITSQETT